MSLASLFIEVSAVNPNYKKPLPVQAVSGERRFAFDVSPDSLPQDSRRVLAQRIVTALVDVAGTVIQPDGDGSVILRDGKVVVETRESVQEIARRIRHEQQSSPINNEDYRPSTALAQRHIREP